MPEFRTLELTEEERVTTVTIRWPEPVGALVEPLLVDLENLLTLLEDTSHAALVVFRGVDTEKPAARSPLPDIEHCRRWEKALVRIDRLASVTLAAIDGACQRYCAQLAIACDYRLASKRSHFHMPEVKEGYLPGMSTFRLAKFVGLGVARRIVFTCAPVSADDAYAWGLIDSVCTADDFKATLESTIEDLAGIDRTTAQLARRLLNESFSTSFEDAIGHFIAAQHRCLQRLT